MTREDTVINPLLLNTLLLAIILAAKWSCAEHRTILPCLFSRLSRSDTAASGASSASSATFARGLVFLGLRHCI